MGKFNLFQESGADISKRIVPVPVRLAGGGLDGGSQGCFRQVNETVLTGSLGDARKVSTALSDYNSDEVQ
jgi:hypothetical protein